MYQMIGALASRIEF